MNGKVRNSLLVVGAVVLLVFALGQQAVKTVIIPATEDSYVVADLAAPDDPQGLRTKNYGSLEFLKTWYAFGVLDDERLFSIDLIKFDLSELKNKEIESAFVQFFVRQADLTDVVRLVDVHVVKGPWAESTVTYDTRPPWDQVPVATAAIYGAGGWYSWNVTGSTVTASRTGELSFAVGLRTTFPENEEQVVFVSKEGIDKAPRLLVTYKAFGDDFAWWWWIVVGVGAAVLSGGAFLFGLRLRR